MREALIEFWPHAEKPTIDQHERSRVAEAAFVAAHVRVLALTELFERHVEEHC